MKKKRYTEIAAALCFTLILGGCNHAIEPLKRSDLERWVRAYENIAAVSPKLLDQKRASRADTVLTCSACRSTLEDQLVKAGYPNLRTFLVIDTRIRAAQVDFLHRQMTIAFKLVDNGVREQAKEKCVTSGSADANQQIVEHSMALVCWVLTKKIEQMRQTSELEDAIISKMTIESDVVFVGENYATVDRAGSDQRLIEEYRNGQSPEEKHAPNPKRVQACNRLELGLGDAQDKTTCPEIKAPLQRPIFQRQKVEA